MPATRPPDGVTELATQISGLGWGKGQQMQLGIDQIVPFRLLGNGLARHQAQDHVDAFDHAVALLGRIDAEHHCIRRQQPRAEAEHATAHGHMVELDDPVRRHQRVVIGERDDAGAEPDAPRALGRGGHEQFRRGDDLVTGRMMLADPGLFIAEPVEPFHQLQVAPDGQGRVLLDRMERCEEHTMA